MNEAILFCGALIFAFAFRIIGKKLENKDLTIIGKDYSARALFFKGLSVALFFLYMPELFMRDALAEQIGLLPIEGENAIATAARIPYSPTATVFLLLLKWVTGLTVAVLVMLPFFNKKEADDYAAFIAPIVVVLNCVFFREIVDTILFSSTEAVEHFFTCKTPEDVLNYFMGENPLYHWRIVLHACVIALCGAISFERLIHVVLSRDFKRIFYRLGRLAVYFVLYAIAFMPMYAPQLLFGHVGAEPAGFTVPHRIIVYFTFLFPLGIHFLFGKRSMEERKYMLIMLALSGFFSFFGEYIYPRFTYITALPLHLCNTAIALMVFAYVFKWKGVFYFTYFVNIMGAICALLLPNTSGPLTEYGNIRFFYNHIYAIVLPFLGVSLGVFERPTIKLMYKAILFFTVYVVAAAVLNAWFNNSPSLNPNGSEIDYFFLYSNFFVDKSIFRWAYHLKVDYVWQFMVGDSNWTFYYIYILLIYGIAIVLMFALWGVYGALYRVEDSHRELARRKRLMRVDRLELLKEMNGRPLTEPLHPEGANMIKISHFSKAYSGSNRHAVHDLNLEIYEGEVFGFIGHNGAGKSTTIKSLVGIQTITDGTIEIQGYDIARQPLEAKLNIGYVSDNHAVYEKLTGREYVSYVADLYMVSEKDKQERIAYYADLFGLTPAMDSEVKSYSHGMKQKLMVISALIHNPKVWILDEPLTGLDPTSAYQIKECMRAHANAGNIVFFSSHVIEVVEKICDRVAIISGGRLRRVCTPEELKNEGQSLEELYLLYAAGAQEENKEETVTTQDAAVSDETKAEEKESLLTEVPAEELASSEPVAEEDAAQEKEVAADKADNKDEQ